MGRPYAFSTRTGDILRADISINQSTFANIMILKSENHFREHLSNDPDFYKVIDIYHMSSFGDALAVIVDFRYLIFMIQILAFLIMLQAIIMKLVVIIWIYIVENL